MNESGKWIPSLPIALLALSVATAGAQELRGRIMGVVEDAEGRPLPGATVTASSPALIQPRSTTAGDKGSYHFPSLPPGLYSLTFELANYATETRQEVRVHLSRTLDIDVKLGAEQQSKVGLLDVSGPKVGTSFTREVLEELPSARDLWSAIARAPGFQVTGYDVGGSHMGTETGYETYGYFGQNRTVIEGINATEGQNGNAGYFDYGSFEELVIGGAGNLGEQNGLGAFVNVTIQSGSEAFHGSAYLSYVSEAMASDNVPPELREPGGTVGGFKAPPGGLESSNPLSEQYEIDLGLGGPIVPGKAWFFGGFRYNDQDKLVLGIPWETEIRLSNLTLKGTYQLDARNQIVGFLNRRSLDRLLQGVSLVRPRESAWWQRSTNLPAKAEWTSAVTDRAFLDVQLSYWRNSFPLFPTATESASVVGVPLGRSDRASSQQQGAHSYYQDRSTTKPQLAGTLSYFRDGWGGTHDFKLGAELYRERTELLRFQPGDIYYWDRGDRTEDVDIYNTPNRATNDTALAAFYAQDGWTIDDRLTLNLGVRLDRYRLSWPAQSASPNQTDFFTPVSVGDTTLATLTSLNPRLGLVYDLSGTGRTLIKAFWGRFASNPSTTLGADENPVGQTASRYRFADLNGNRVLDPGPDGSLASSPELGPLVETLGGGATVRVDRDLEPEIGSELSAHVEHELREGFTLRGSFVRKNLRDGWAQVDLDRAFAYDIPFTYQDVGADATPGTSDDQTIELLDRSPFLLEDRVWTNPGRIGLPDYQGDYHTAELALNRRFQNRWLLLASYGYTWADDFRGTNISTSTLEAARNAREYLWQPNRRRFGRMSTSYWNLKLGGHYVLPHEIGISASYKLQSGFQVARRIDVRLPNAGVESIHAEPLGNERADDVGVLDLRLEKTLGTGGKARVTWMFEVFNLMNANPVVNFRNVTGSRYKEVVALLDPRIMRLAIRFDF